MLCEWTHAMYGPWGSALLSLSRILWRVTEVAVAQFVLFLLLNSVFDEILEGVLKTIDCLSELGYLPS